MARAIRTELTKEARLLAEVPFPETETVPVCPSCGSSESSMLFEAIDRMYHLPGLFSFVKCSGCGLVRLSPRPTQENIAVYYPEDLYYSYQETADDTVRGIARNFRDRVRNIALDSFGYHVRPLGFFDKTLRPIVMTVLGSRVPYGWGKRFPRHVPNGKALDIGCGRGTYLSLLKGLGWEVFGVELSQRAKQAAKEHFDIDIYCGDISDVPFDRESFDHIHISHTIEHLYDPFAVLAKVRELLKPDGTVYIEVPNVGSYNAAAAGKYWFHWDAPRHLFGFTPKTLRDSIENAGLKVSKMTTQLTEVQDLEDLYQAEEEKGAMLADRSFAQRNLKPSHLARRIRARLAYLLNKEKGDFICCWARRRN